MLPLYRLYWGRFPPSGTGQEPIRDEGGLFRSLPISFHHWVRQRKWLKSSLWVDFLAFGIVLSMTFLIGSTFGFPTQIFELQYDGALFIDLHFVGSFLMLSLCAVYAAKKLENFLTFYVLFVTASVLWVCSASLLYGLGLRPNLCRAVLLWLEPMVICLGCAGAVFIFQELKTVSWRRKRSRDRAAHISHPQSVQPLTNPWQDERLS